MVRSRLDREAVVGAAIALVDDRGLDALTLTNVADVLGVRPSALYSHVDGAGHLHYVVAVRATGNLTREVRNAAIGVAGDDALRSVAEAYRRFALSHRGQYTATLSPPAATDDELIRAGNELLDVLGLVVRSLGLPDSGAQHAARAVRSTLHGFLALECRNPRDAGGEDFEHLVGMLVRGLSD